MEQLLFDTTRERSLQRLHPRANASARRRSSGAGQLQARLFVLHARDVPTHQRLDKRHNCTAVPDFEAHLTLEALLGWQT